MKHKWLSYENYEAKLNPWIRGIGFNDKLQVCSEIQWSFTLQFIRITMQRFPLLLIKYPMFDVDWYRLIFTCYSSYGGIWPKSTPKFEGCITFYKSATPLQKSFCFQENPYKIPENPFVFKKISHAIWEEWHTPRLNSFQGEGGLKQCHDVLCLYQNIQRIHWHGFAHTGNHFWHPQYTQTKLFPLLNIKSMYEYNMISSHST